MSETSLININEKIRLGCFYTTQNIFSYPQFKEWFTAALKASNSTVLEPFAGSNNLIKMLQDERYNFDFVAYDINPGSSEVEKKDTIKEFPQGHKLIITNPPYLAKNSARRKKINFPNTKYDDLYKLCLEIMLKNCDYVGAIIPASFINAELFQERLHSYTLLVVKCLQIRKIPFAWLYFHRRGLILFIFMKTISMLENYIR